MQNKNPGLAAVLSFFISGLGQIYNCQIAKGLITIAVQAINLVLTSIVIGFVTGGIVWIWSIYDAYKTAQRANQNNGLAEPKIGSGGGAA